MAIVTYILIIQAIAATARYCGIQKAPFELGEWNGHLQRLDSAAIDNNPVSIAEGQYYIYENSFPGYTIKYIHVDNVARRTCGATASLKRGGVGGSTVLLILHADSNSEIRSVIDVWGVPGGELRKRTMKPLGRVGDLQNMRSKYLFMGQRTLNHNTRSDSPSDSD